MKECCCESDMIPEDYLKLRRYKVGSPAKRKNIFFRDHFASFLHFVSSQKNAKMFFWPINWCSYKTMVFTKLSHFAEIFAQNFFGEILLHFRLIYFPEKCKISRKSLRNAAENFRILSRNVSFAGNPSP